MRGWHNSQRWVIRCVLYFVDRGAPPTAAATRHGGGAVSLLKCWKPKHTPPGAMHRQAVRGQTQVKLCCHHSKRSTTPTEDKHSDLPRCSTNQSRHNTCTAPRETHSRTQRCSLAGRHTIQLRCKIGPSHPPLLDLLQKQFPPSSKKKRPLLHLFLRSWPPFSPISPASCQQAL